MKNISCLFERPFKIQKNGVFLLEISFFVLGYTRGHLHNRVKGHKQQSSAIAKHYKNMHGTMPQDLLKRFQVLKKCKNKCDCLVYEMLCIRALKPNLNVHSDSIRAKVFL